MWNKNNKSNKFNNPKKLNEENNDITTIASKQYVDRQELMDLLFDSRKNNPHDDPKIAQNHLCEHDHFANLIDKCKIIYPKIAYIVHDSVPVSGYTFQPNENLQEKPVAIKSSINTQIMYCSACLENLKELSCYCSHCGSLFVGELSND